MRSVFFFVVEVHILYTHATHVRRTKSKEKSVNNIAWCRTNCPSHTAAPHVFGMYIIRLYNIMLTIHYTEWFSRQHIHSNFFPYNNHVIQLWFLKFVSMVKTIKFSNSWISHTVNECLVAVPNLFYSNANQSFFL